MPPATAPPAPPSAGSVALRRYRPSDRAAVRRLHDLALNSVGAHGGSGTWDEDLDRIPEVYLEDRGEFLVGTFGGRLVAMGAIRRGDRDTARLTRMRVHPDLWRLGIGRRLVRRLEARARRLGYSRLVLDTAERQTAAIALYRAEGYVETGRGEVAGLAAVFFEKRLAPAGLRNLAPSPRSASPRAPNADPRAAAEDRAEPSASAEGGPQSPARR
ncbi:MAG TPA: GNAT family N-acetyltransferase [Candidatus Binatia bacterium]|nr:GNAT family N-acetyltransferase [Candidatus Binatia bacterium]